MSFMMTTVDKEGGITVSPEIPGNGVD